MFNVDSKGIRLSFYHSLEVYVLVSDLCRADLGKQAIENYGKVFIDIFKPKKIFDISIPDDSLFLKKKD